MNITEVATRVKRTFGDESGIQIQDSDIIRWINDAQEQIILENEGLMEATGTASTVANQRQYTLPVDLSVLRSLAYQGNHLKSLNFNEFNANIDGYQSSDILTGTPTVYTVWNKEVWLYPVPLDSVADAINIYYIRHCPIITTLADELSVPLQYHNAVVKFALAQAYELDENLEGKQLKEAEFSNDTAKLNDRNKWISQETYPTITTLPEDEGFYYGY